MRNEDMQNATRDLWSFVSFVLSKWQASEDEAEAAARQRAQAAAEAVQAVAQAQVSQDDCIPFIGVIASSTAESSSLQCDKLKQSVGLTDLCFSLVHRF